MPESKCRAPREALQHISGICLVYFSKKLCFLILAACKLRSTFQDFTAGGSGVVSAVWGWKLDCGLGKSPLRQRRPKRKTIRLHQLQSSVCEFNQELSHSPTVLFVHHDNSLITTISRSGRRQRSFRPGHRCVFLFQYCLLNTFCRLNIRRIMQKGSRWKCINFIPSLKNVDIVTSTIALMLCFKVRSTCVTADNMY